MHPPMDALHSSQIRSRASQAEVVNTTKRGNFLKPDKIEESPTEDYSEMMGNRMNG